MNRKPTQAVRTKNLAQN